MAGTRSAVCERAQRGQRQTGVRGRQAARLEAETPVPADGGALEAGLVPVAVEEDECERVGQAEPRQLRGCCGRDSRVAALIEGQDRGRERIVS